MSNIRRVLVQTRPASANDPGRMDEGFYILSGTELTMTDSEGYPLEDNSKRHVAPGTDPDGVARAALRKDVSGFKRALNYPAAGLA